jgi:hypothetical protein
MLPLRASIALPVLVLVSGCYVEGAATGYGAGGGVSGVGWSVGVNAGAYVDFARSVKVAAAYAPERVRVSGKDGALAASPKSYAGRIDAALVGDDDARLRGTLALSRGKTDLVFSPDGWSRDFSGSGTSYSGFLGATLEALAFDKTSVSVSLGPRVQHISNDFVGNTTLSGLEARLGLWALGDLDSWGSGGEIGHDATPRAQPVGDENWRASQRTQQKIDEQQRQNEREREEQRQREQRQWK